MKTDRFSGRRARTGLANKLFFLMTGVTFGVAAACSYDYKALMGPEAGPDGGSGGSGGRSGSGGSVVATGSGGELGTGTGGAVGSGGGAATGGGTATGGATPTGSGGTVGTGGAGTGTGGAVATGGAAGSATTGTGGATGAGTGGMVAVTGGRGGTSSAGGAAAGGTLGTGGAGTGGAATGGAASGGAPGSGGAGGSATGGALADPDLVLWYRFEEASGIAVADSATAASTPHAGMLATFGTGGEAVFSATHQVGTRSVALTSNGATGGGYVILPSLQDLAPNAITLSIWVQVTTAQRWQRVFDLGNTTTTNMALTTQDGTDSVRFVIRVNGGGAEQIINTTSKLTLSVWHHLAVVLRAGAPYTGEIFVDGVSAGTNTAMTWHAVDLGATVNNFLGRSQFAADPYWSGMFDDFRVYRRALTGAEVAAVMLQR